MVRAMSTFLEFCYLVRQDMIDEVGLEEIKQALQRFHEERVIFEQVGVRADGFSLPRQHSCNDRGIALFFFFFIIYEVVFRRMLSSYP